MLSCSIQVSNTSFSPKRPQNCCWTFEMPYKKIVCEHAPVRTYIGSGGHLMAFALIDFSLFLTCSTPRDAVIGSTADQSAPPSMSRRSSWCWTRTCYQFSKWALCRIRTPQTNEQHKKTNSRIPCNFRSQLTVDFVFYVTGRVSSISTCDSNPGLVATYQTCHVIGALAEPGQSVPLT